MEHTENSSIPGLNHFFSPVRHLFPQFKLAPANLKMAGLSCKSIPVPIQEAGDYIFQLQAFTGKNLNKPADSFTSDTISVEPAMVPQILEFLPTQAIYQPSQPSQSSNSSSGLIRLNWDITNADNIKELNLIGLAADGSISGGVRRYAIVNNTLPPELSSFCKLGANLVCRNVPTTAQKAGAYTFKLSVMPKQNQEMQVEKNTPVVKIQSSSPKILSFQLNGKEIGQQPKFIYELSQARPVTNVVLSWNIEKAKGTTVELLPAPGTVPSKGSLNYPLSKSPSRETLTLRVTNAAGEQVVRTIILETIEPVPPPSPQALPGVSSSVYSREATSPENSPFPNKNQLLPIELPPQSGQNP